MNTLKAVVLAAVAALGFAASAHGAATRGFSLQVVLEGRVRPEYRARGAVYVEAVRGRPYVLRVTNPLPVRVAVALAVDGLNTIDARRSDPGAASKWVLGPYETVEIPGWQVSGRDARRFFFTGERSSYGAWLGETENLGVVEAVFYRERVRPMPISSQPIDRQMRESVPRGDASPAPAEGVGSAAGCPPKAKALSDEYAATGIGERTRHDVERVDLELEDRPAAVVRIRYEFREQLVGLGVLPTATDPLTRREGARGFEEYCPDPFGRR